MFRCLSKPSQSIRGHPLINTKYSFTHAWFTIHTAEDHLLQPCPFRVKGHVVHRSYTILTPKLIMNLETWKLWTIHIHLLHPGNTFLSICGFLDPKYLDILDLFCCAVQGAALFLSGRGMLWHLRLVCGPATFCRNHEADLDCSCCVQFQVSR